MRFGFACGLACGFACVLVGVICAADVEERRERVERAGRDKTVWDRPSSEQVDAAETSAVHVLRGSDAGPGRIVSRGSDAEPGRIVVADADVEERRERVRRAGRDEAVVERLSSERVAAAETSAVHVARGSDAELGSRRRRRRGRRGAA